MAKLTLSLLLLFFLIASSESLTPSDLPTGDVADRDLPGSEADSTAAILLPSEKPRTEAAATVAAVEIDPETAAVAAVDSSNTQDAADVPVLEDHAALEPGRIASVPLRTITFRPHDHGGLPERTVPLSLRFPFRHGGRGCRHGRRQFRPRFEGREISFGNDMILSGEKPGHDAESRGLERQMAGRWIRIHHRKPRFGFADVAWKEDRDMMNGPDRRHEEHEDDEEREHHHRRWNEDKDMMRRPHRPEERKDDDDEIEHHHRRWDMMKRPHRPEEREDEEEREHHHRRWKEDKDMMKRLRRPEEHEDDDEEREHHHHHRHHHHFRRHHHDHDDEEEERHGGEGIFKRIRKFLDHF